MIRPTLTDEYPVRANHSSRERCLEYRQLLTTVQTKTGQNRGLWRMNRRRRRRRRRGKEKEEEEEEEEKEEEEN